MAPQHFPDNEAGMAELGVRRFTQLQHEPIQNYSRLTEIPPLPKISEEKGTFLVPLGASIYYVRKIF